MREPERQKNSFSLKFSHEQRWIIHSFRSTLRLFIKIRIFLSLIKKTRAVFLTKGGRLLDLVHGLVFLQQSVFFPGQFLKVGIVILQPVNFFFQLDVALLQSPVFPGKGIDLLLHLPVMNQPPVRSKKKPQKK